MLMVGCKPKDVLETEGTLSGKVIEASTNQPLANAVVSITGQTYTTGSDGTYFFGDLSEGEYSVEVSLSGYQSEKKLFSVRAGKETKADFSLKPIYSVVQVSTQSLDFGTTLDALTFEIIKPEDSSAIDWEIAGQANANWIRFSENSGTLKAPRATITVFLNRAELTEEKVYTTEIIVKTKNGGATHIRVSAMKGGAVLVADPSSVEFGAAESEKTILIKNPTGEGTLHFKAKATESWIVLEGAEGTITKTDVATIKVRVSRLKLSAGAYNSNIIISSNRNTVTVPISMQVLGKQRPEVGNMQSAEVKHTSFNVSAYISSVGSAAVTSYGFCWSKDKTQPTTADNKNNLGGTSVAKSFNSTITGLLPRTTYYVRAYAINEEGVAYSEPFQIATLAAPTNPVVRTLSPIKVQYNAATLKGYIENLGDGYVTSYGFCYSTSNRTPTIADQSMSLGSTTSEGEFEGSITGLKEKTKYYIRAYATNAVGTAYGGAIEINTPVAPPLVQEGLLAYYTFDNQNCDDALGEEDYNGLVQGQGSEMSFVKDTPTASGYALKGSDGGKYFKILRAPDKGQADVTYSFWVKTKDTNARWFYVLGDVSSTGYHQARRVGFDKAKAVCAFSWSIFTTFSTELQSLALDGRWHHVVMSLKSGKNTLYIDGRYIEEGSAYWNSSYYSHATALLGSYQGIMDNLRIYNRILTQDEIKEIYRAKQ